MQQPSTPQWARLLVALLLLGLATPTTAEEVAEAAPAPPVVPLDQLLKLPDSAPVNASIEKRGGDTKAEWRARFQAARKDLTVAERELQEVRDKLEERAAEGGSWKMGAPGLGQVSAPTDSPLDYKLSQDIRKKREEAELARRRMRDLEVEANLADVPDTWRSPDGR